MRKSKRNMIRAMILGLGVGIMASAVHASVIFIGDNDKVGFGAAKKIMPTIFKCQDGQEWYKGKCVKKCDHSVYPYDQTGQDKPYETKRGTSKTCTDVWGSYFAFTACHEGWDLKDGYCEVSPCTNYNFNESPSTLQGTVGKCKRGDNWVYKYTACNEGWDYDGVYQCSIHSCSSTSYPYTSSPSADAGTIVNCKTGTSTRYGYSECRTGWDKSNGYCNIHVCDTATYPYTTAQSSDAGTVISCKTGKDTRYGFTSCNEGWGFANNQCTMNSCDGFNSTSASITGCKQNASCQKGPTTMYQCTTCYTGYTKNSQNNCTMSCTFTATSLPSNCSSASNCKRGDASGDKTYYATTCSSCNSNYYVSGGSCSACTWGGRSLTSCPSGCNCSSDTCGGTTKYSVSSAKSNYYQSGNRCYACSWSYSLSSCPSNCYCYSDSCGGTTKYGVSSARSGYYVSGNSCYACSWSGTLSSCPSNCNCSSDSCGGTTKYSITSARSGYYVSGNSCYACSWSGTLSSCPSNCNCSSDSCGGTTKYSISSARSGYYVSGNSCPACTWGGKSLTSCPSNCNCASETCSGTTKYSITSAKSGYTVSGNSCIKACTPSRQSTMYPNCHGGSAKAKTDNCGDTYYVCSGNAKVYEYAFIVNSKCKGCYKQYGDVYNFVYDSGRKIYTPDGSYLLSDQSYGCGSIASWDTQSACESHRSQYYTPSTDYIGTTSMEY